MRVPGNRLGFYSCTSCACAHIALHCETGLDQDVHCSWILTYMYMWCIGSEAHMSIANLAIVQFADPDPCPASSKVMWFSVSSGGC